MNFFLSRNLSHLWHIQVLRKMEVCILLATVFLGLLQEHVFVGFPHPASEKNSIHRMSLSLSLFHKILAHVFTQKTSRERWNALYFTKHSVNEDWVLLQRLFPFLSGCWSQVPTGIPISENILLGAGRHAWMLAILFENVLPTRPGWDNSQTQTVSPLRA